MTNTPALSPALVALVTALARRQARVDHEREQAERKAQEAKAA